MILMTTDGFKTHARGRWSEFLTVLRALSERHCYHLYTHPPPPLSTHVHMTVFLQARGRRFWRELSPAGAGGALAHALPWLSGVEGV